MASLNSPQMRPIVNWSVVLWEGGPRALTGGFPHPDDPVYQGEYHITDHSCDDRGLQSDRNGGTRIARGMHQNLKGEL